VTLLCPVFILKDFSGTKKLQKPKLFARTSEGSNQWKRCTMQRDYDSTEGWTDLASSIDKQQSNGLQCPLNQVKKSRFRHWSTVVADGKTDQSRYGNIRNKEITVWTDKWRKVKPNWLQNPPCQGTASNHWHCKYASLLHRKQNTAGPALQQKAVSGKNTRTSAY